MSDAKDLRGQQQVTHLLNLLVNGDTYSSIQAAAALATVGSGVEESLLALLTDGETTDRWNVAMALARIGAPAVDGLIAVAKTGDNAVRNPAVWALAEIGDTRAVEPLAAILRRVLPSAAGR